MKNIISTNSNEKHKCFLKFIGIGRFLYRISFCLFFTLLPNLLFSQINITATVKDLQNSEVLPYCNVSIVGTNKGTITNADGVFSIVVKSKNDILEFSFIGYKKIRLTAKSILKHQIVKLEKQSINLQEVTIAGSDDFLYSMLINCRRKLNRNNKRTVSKAYFGLESETSGKPAEFLECYFNSELQGQKIIDLILKNGRLAHNILDHSISQNIETSKAIILFNITNDNSFYPIIPTQLTKTQMMKKFHLFLIPADSSMFRIGFLPKTKDGSHFSGEYWIDKKTMLLRKISLNIEDAKVYPFATIVDDKMDSINLGITITYKITNKTMCPELITFDYSYRIQRRTGGALYWGPLKNNGTAYDDMTVMEQIAEFKSYNVKSVLYFYDFKKLFIAPFFEYDTDISDYAKLTLIPYNPKFWEYNKAILLNKEQKRKINFITDEDYKFISKEDQYGKDFMLDERVFIFQDTVKYSGLYTFWHHNKRVFIDKSMHNNKTADKHELIDLPISSLIKFKVQILLDIVEAEDSLICSSYTVFEDLNSYYKKPIDPNSNVLLNIFFDICEIEREKMQSILDSTCLTLKQIKNLYEKTNNEILLITTNFLNDVSYGKNTEKINTWNNYIYEKLEINNLELFAGYYNKRKIYTDSIIKSGEVPPFNVFE
ncbi:MAG: carboxypeptidase-like regulatory domain-containing protein [Bacteroidales bacterium]|nr:carboxypeptidase-like regulatory domain-containing protein [Bacteroidales bacterium]